MDQNSLFQYSWMNIRYLLLVLPVNQPCEGEFVSLPAFCIWHTWTWCCAMHFVLQYSKIFVEPGFSLTLFAHGGCLHAFNSTLKPGQDAQLREGSDVSNLYWLLLCSIYLSIEFCCHCQQKGKFCQVVLHFLSSVVFKFSRQLRKAFTLSHLQDQQRGLLSF